MRSTYYKVVPAFGKEKGKGFVVLLFNGRDNMTQGAMEGVFFNETDAHKAAQARGLNEVPTYYTDGEGFEVWSG